jgi:DNA modification methylase
MSVLNTTKGEWIERQRAWKALGIKSEVGRAENMTFAESINISGSNGTSVFDPVLTEIMYRWFTPNDNSEIIDPFAGGSVRGVIAKILGHNYTGVDLRQEQIEANYSNAQEIGLDGITWHCDDSLNMDKYAKDGTKDFLIACPPYFDLEVYSDNEKDISNMSWADFKDTYVQIMRTTAKKLKDNRFAVVVISDVRDKKTGEYLDLTGTTKESFKQEGFIFYNDIILLNTFGSGAMRARRYMKNRKVCRVHQNVLVFYKGKHNDIQKHFPELTDYDDVVLGEEE